MDSTSLNAENKSDPRFLREQAIIAAMSTPKDAKVVKIHPSETASQERLDAISSLRTIHEENDEADQAEQTEQKSDKQLLRREYKLVLSEEDNPKKKNKKMLRHFRKKKY